MEEQLEITADILDYLGKYENGVLVLLTIGYKGEFTEGTIYYSDQMLALTVDESIEQDLGMKIEFWSGYRDLLILILRKVVPYSEIINRLDEIDVNKYIDVSIDSKEAEDISEEDIKTEE
jgi:hypothetical protein